LLKFNGTYQVIIYGDDVHLWCRSIHSISLIFLFQESGLEANVEINILFLLQEQHAAQDHNT
jgi:hypothetical protein